VSLFRTKSIDALIAASEEPEKKLRRTLGPWSLTALGIGAVIGSGIFTLTGTAAAGKVIPVKNILEATVLDLVISGSAAHSQMGRPGAGPAITLSFLLVAIACLFAGLCYAELASMIPIAGSAYTYSYAILGEIVAWIIGWDLILEYAVSNMSVAVGFSAYLQDLFENVFGFHLPSEWAFPPFPAPGGPSGVFNVPALVITLLVTWILVRGVRESAGKKKGTAGRKIGNAHLKWAFSEATCLVIRSLPKAKTWLARKERKIGKKRALGALAARLARTVYHLWRKQEAFDVKRFLAS